MNDVSYNNIEAYHMEPFLGSKSAENGRILLDLLGRKVRVVLDAEVISAA
jgi:hypothetical protein